MSVTFGTAIDPDAPVVWFIECADGLRRDAWEGSWDEGRQVVDAHPFGCSNEDCREYGAGLMTVHDGPEVNMANGNARVVLEALGLPFEDGSGSLPAEAFLGRVLLALGLAPADEGVPPHQMVPGESTIFGPVREGGATFIDCGRRPGYLQERLVQLEEVATHALSVGREVSWG